MDHLGPNAVAADASMFMPLLNSNMVDEGQIFGGGGKQSSQQFLICGVITMFWELRPLEQSLPGCKLWLPLFA
jgi:hypothetical protein